MSWRDKPCKEWSGTRFANGYGRTYRNGKSLKAHRVAYEEEYGEIPDGLLVCHHCDNPPCVEPTHLFLGTHAQNHADRDEKGRQVNMRKTHCPKGHPYDAENTYVYRGKRQCGACRRERWTESNRAISEARRERREAVSND